MNMIPFFSISTKDIKTTFGANLNSILTGTFKRKKRKIHLKKGLPHALHVTEVHSDEGPHVKIHPEPYM